MSTRRGYTIAPTPYTYLAISIGEPVLQQVEQPASAPPVHRLPGRSGWLHRSGREEVEQEEEAEREHHVEELTLQARDAAQHLQQIRVSRRVRLCRV